MTIFLGILYIIVPVFIIFFSEKNKIANKIGAVILAYAFGLLLGHIGLIPHPGKFLSQAIQDGLNIGPEILKNWLLQGKISPDDVLAYDIYQLQDLATSITIPLALPLLLFSFRLDQWLQVSGKTLLSTFLVILSVIAFVVFGYFIFGDNLKEPNKIAGMLIGLYTGGTPNLASLKQSLGVDTETYIMAHTYDTAIGMLYLLFLMSLGKYLFRAFLLPYPMSKKNGTDDDIANFSESAYHGFFKKGPLKGHLAALGATIAIVGISVTLGLIFKSHFMLVVILSITTLGIIFSFVPKINKLEKTFELGMYFIIVFSFVVASMADIGKLMDVSSFLLGYIAMVYVGSLFLHAVLGKVFKIDSDTLMVTSTALLCSPPFVPMVAGSLRNKEIIAPGLTVGVFGYAIGNYLGTFIATILELFV